MLKLAIWQIPGVSEGHFWISGAVFLKMGQKSWNLEILPFLQNFGWNGQNNHQKQFWELKYRSFRAWSWKIGETAIFRVFTPKLTVFGHGPIYLGWATRNSDFWLKSTFSLIKVDIKAKKPPLFSWRPQLKSIKCVFLSNKNLIKRVKLTILGNRSVYPGVHTWNGNFGSNSTLSHLEIDINSKKLTHFRSRIVNLTHCIWFL